MNSQTLRTVTGIAVCAIGMAILAPAAEAGVTCIDSAGNSPCEGTNSPCVYVKRNDFPPLEGIDFEIDLTDPINPGVILKTGTTTDEWIIWSQKNATSTNPARLGTISIDATVLTDDFSVTIDRGPVPGASNVLKIDLKDPNPLWSGYSSVSGSIVSLDGNLLAVSDGTAGGDVNLTVTELVKGNVVAESITLLDVGAGAFHVIEVSMVGNITATTVDDILIDAGYDGTMDIGEILTNGSIDIGGKVTGASAVTVDKMNTFTLFEVNGTVESGASFTFDELLGAAGVNWVTVDFRGFGSAPDFSGDLTLKSGVPEHTFVNIRGDTALGSTINLSTKDVAGNFGVWGGEVAIMRGGNVTGSVFLASAPNNPDFEGTATFAGMSGAGAEIRTSQGDLIGDLTFTGAVLDGTIQILGNVTGTGSITVGGNMGGDIDVNGDVDGDIAISGDLNDIIDISGDLGGDISIGGDSNATIAIHDSLQLNGRILVDGILSGDVTISNETVGGSLIRATDGLDAATTVTVNAGSGDFHADGAMYFGDASPFSPVNTTFDGNVHIKKSETGGGQLNGALTVRGCHATNADLDICICDPDSARSPVILQGGCANQVVDSCVSGCF